jgi:thioredoxin-like negative regulator of GroEL
MFKTWKNVGKRFMNDTRVVIAEIDCETNERTEYICERYEVEYYPTFILFDQAREYDNFIAMQSKRDLVKAVKSLAKRQTKKEKIKDDN